jgi:DNA-binding transcriptional MerR regulator
MGQYSIKDIESLSGIKAHTLRIWEQRYAILTPHRTGTNIRYYTDDQLKMILNIALLNKKGYKISRIAEMDEQQIKDTILHLDDTAQGQDTLLDSLIRCMIDFDEVRFEKTLNTAIIRMGFAQAYEDLLLPFLQRTGILWSTGLIKPVQEHFMSNLIRRKLSVAIDNQYVGATENSRKFVLFLPEGEWHELMLLFTEFILRSHGHIVLYLGSAVPLDDIYSLENVFHPDYLVSFITVPMQHITVQNFINKLSNLSPKIKVMIGGPQIAAQKPVFPSNVVYLNDKLSLLECIGIMP